MKHASLQTDTLTSIRAVSIQYLILDRMRSWLHVQLLQLTCFQAMIDVRIATRRHSVQHTLPPRYANPNPNPNLPKCIQIFYGAKSTYSRNFMILCCLDCKLQRFGLEAPHCNAVGFIVRALTTFLSRGIMGQLDHLHSALRIRVHEDIIPHTSDGGDVWSVTWCFGAVGHVTCQNAAWRRLLAND